MRNLIKIGGVIFALLGIMGAVWIGKNVNREETIEGEVEEIPAGYLFQDVAEKEEASAYIAYVTEREIMPTKEDGFFYPNSQVSWQEGVQYALKATLPRLVSGEISQEEENQLLLTYHVIEKAYDADKWNRSMTNGEFLILLAKLDIVVRNYSQEVISFSITNSHWGEEEKALLIHALARGFYDDENESEIYFNRYSTRAEVAKMLFGYMTH